MSPKWNPSGPCALPLRTHRTKGTHTNMLVFALLAVLPMIWSLFSDPEVSCLLPASTEHWQAHLLACQQGKIKPQIHCQPQFDHHCFQQPILVIFLFFSLKPITPAYTLLYTVGSGTLQTISQMPFPDALLLVSANMKTSREGRRKKNPASHSDRVSLGGSSFD